MKTWLKGGLWGAGIIAFLEIVSLILAFSLHGSFEAICWYLFIFTSLPLAMLGLVDLQYFSINGIIIMIIWSILVFFLIGAIIGKIIGKIKSRA